MIANWEKLRPHKLQNAAWTTKKRFVNLACGRGSGKTELARRRVIRYLPVKKPWSDPLYFYALPTYKQARRVAWKPLLKLLPEAWIKKVYNHEMYIETIFGSTLYVVGMDNPQRIEGVQWDGGVIDEACDTRPGVFNIAVMPALSHRSAWCWRIGVPKRTGIGAHEFREVFKVGEDNEDADMVSYSWPSSDILSTKQLEAAKRLLDPRDYKEQYEASWIDQGGLVYYAFSYKNLDSSAGYDPSKKIIVSSDFNVNPMCWVLAHKYPDKVVVFDEIVLSNTNTIETLNMLHQRYGMHESGWVFMGDAAGRARKTSASKSDYLHITNDVRFGKDKEVYYSKANPPIKDRFASVNAALQNAQGETRAFINPKCKTLIKDLDSVCYKEGTLEPDETIPNHMSDAFGYMVYKFFPVCLSIGVSQITIKT